MKKYLKLLVVACMCACVAFAVAACGGQQQPSSSSSSALAVSDKTESSSQAAKPKVSDEPFYAMVAGNDTRYGTADGEGTTENDPSFSDTMMLLRIDPKGHRVSVLSLPRDTLITLNGSPEKLNAAHYAYGMDGEQGTVKQVEALTGVKIDYYFDTTFANFEKLIDEMGGVTVNVPVTIELADIVHSGEEGEPLVVNAGEGQALNGPQALVFSRMRKDYAYQGEAVRQMNARQVVCSGIAFVSERPANTASTYAKLLTSTCKTNMPEDTLTAYIEMFMGNPITFQTGSGPYVGGWIGDTWGVSGDAGTYASLIQAMETGGDMQAIVADPVASI